METTAACAASSSFRIGMTMVIEVVQSILVLSVYDTWAKPCDTACIPELIIIKWIVSSENGLACSTIIRAAAESITPFTAVRAHFLSGVSIQSGPRAGTD